MANDKQKQEVKFIENKKADLVVTITAGLEQKFRELFSLESSNEISGILFYKVKEMNKEFSKIRLEAFDFLLMDIGSSAHSEFDYSNKIAWYIMDKEYSDDVHYGICHSHPKFSTMASSTDMKTIFNEGNDRVHFLSLIINVYGEYNVWFTRKYHVECERKYAIKYKTFGGANIESSGKAIDSYDAVEYVHGKVEIERTDISSEVKLMFNNVKEEINKRAMEAIKIKKEIGYIDNETRDLFNDSQTGLSYEESLAIRSLFYDKETESLPITVNSILSDKMILATREEIIEILECNKDIVRCLKKVKSKKIVKSNPKILNAVNYAIGLLK